MAVAKLLGKDHPGFEYVYDLMHSSIVQHDNDIPLKEYNLLNVFKIQDNKSCAKFWDRIKKMKKKHSMNNQDICILFHGSPHAWDIVRDGFDARLSSDGNMFGKGIYFSNRSSKANQYSWGNNVECPEHNDIACSICVRYMLICKGSMGRKFRPSCPQQTVPPGYHSVEADPHSNPEIAEFLRHPEFVLFSKNQVLPLYLVEYTIKLDRPSASIAQAQSDDISSITGSIGYLRVVDSSSDDDDDDYYYYY